MALTTSNLDGTLKLLNKGKVRDVYELSPTSLLFVATDRISAYDVIMENGVPGKGKLLTAISGFWFTQVLKDVCPNHLISISVPEELSRFKDQLQGRTMVVKKLKILPIEAIVRGYLSGSAWNEYKKSGTVHGIKVPEGMKESQKFETPIFTPSTKAEQGEHDENIHPSQVPAILGEKGEYYAKRIEELALALYTKARDHAAERGIIIADTKFEFGVDENGEVVLVDEVLTPDSSRFWPASEYEIGRGQNSYDKQYLRDWLTTNGLNKKEGVTMPHDVVENTAKKYIEAYELLTGRTWTETQ